MAKQDAIQLVDHCKHNTHNDNDCLFCVALDSLDVPDYYMCANCDYNNEDRHVEDCKVTIGIGQFDDTIMCKCNCNAPNWETPESIQESYLSLGF